MGLLVGAGFAIGVVFAMILVATLWFMILDIWKRLLNWVSPGGTK